MKLINKIVSKDIFLIPTSVFIILIMVFLNLTWVLAVLWIAVFLWSMGSHIFNY